MLDAHRLLTRRFVAFTIDAVLAVLLTIPVWALLSRAEQPGESSSGRLLLAELIALPVASAAYWLLAIGLVHRTVGQQVLGLRVVRDGELIGPRRQLLRCAAAVPVLLSLGVGYVWSILDRDYRSWVDHLSGTSIVRAASLSAPVSGEVDELSAAAIDVSSFNADRSRSVADALEARGHWKASAALFRTISSPAHLEDAGRAAWSFGLAEDDASVLALAHSLWSEREAWPPKLHGAYAIALARGGAHGDAGLALADARASGLAPEESAQVEAQTAAAASEQHTAARLAEHATDLEPESFIAWLVRGRVARRGNDPHEELQSARRARAAAPWSVAALAAEALALGPRRGLHKTITTEEVDALLAVLAADANHAAARQRLWAATTGRRGGALLGAAALFGLALSFAFSDAPSIAFAAVPALGGAALIAWNRLVRRRTARARSWADYLARLRLVRTHRAGGRHLPENVVVEARPPESVLGSPARCWCDSLQHVVGVAASTYVRMHLVDTHASPAPGVYLFACPHERGAYAGIDGGVDPSESQAQLFSIDVSTLRRRDTDASTGMYL